jgi:peptidoglycan-associated lipoprotein
LVDQNVRTSKKYTQSKEEKEDSMNRKPVGLFFCIALIAGLTLLAGCARTGGTVSPDFADADSVTVEPVPVEPKEPERPVTKEPGLGEGIDSGLSEGEVPIPQDQTVREMLFAEAKTVLKPIYFDYDKSDLKPAAKAQLEKSADWLKKNPKVNCRIEGHCDERGTNEYNLSLGERRALSARRYLMSLGVNPDRLFTISYGEERPAEDGHDESAWKFNRRDEFTISI